MSESKPDKPFDMVQCDYQLRAGPIQVGAYRIRDMKTGEFGQQHFHMTFDNYVMAAMGEESARLFINLMLDIRPDLLDDRHKDKGGSL